MLPGVVLHLPRTVRLAPHRSPVAPVGSKITGAFFMEVGVEDQVIKEARIRNEREAVYGEPRACHTRIGEVWGTLLTHAGWKVGTAVEPHLVAACMAVLKVVRGGTAGGGGSQG